jgi:hypothetical protein
MPDSATIQLDRRDVAKLFKQFDRAQKLGKSATSTLQWGGRLVCASIGARTKQAKQKIRPIVKNPHPQAATDNRRANFGVYGYKKGRKKFIPIYRTGEFGKLRFFDKKTVAWYDRSAGSGKWRRIASGADPANPDVVVPGIKTDRRRKVPWRGLAKKSWRAAQSVVTRGGTRGAMGIRGLATVHIKRDNINPAVTITNKLHYAMKALQDGERTISHAMAAAASKMERRITDTLEKRIGA